MIRGYMHIPSNSSLSFRLKIEHIVSKLVLNVPLVANLILHRQISGPEFYNLIADFTSLSWCNLLLTLQQPISSVSISFNSI